MNECDLRTHREKALIAQQPIVLIEANLIQASLAGTKSVIFDACAWGNFAFFASKANGAITMINAGRLGTLRAHRKVCCCSLMRASETKRVVIRQSPQPTRDQSRELASERPTRENNKRLLLLSSLLAWLPLLTTNWVGAPVHGTCPASQSKAQSIRHPHSRLSLKIHNKIYFFLSSTDERDAKWLLPLHRFLRPRARPTMYIFLRAAVFFLIDFAHVHSRHVDLGQMEEIGRYKQI